MKRGELTALLATLGFLFIHYVALTAFQFESATGLRISLTEPDIFYHFKRSLAFANGQLDVFLLDPSLNAPCTFAPPWPWGFDALMGMPLLPAALGGGEVSYTTDGSLVAVWVPLIATLAVGSLYPVFRRFTSSAPLALGTLVVMALGSQVTDVAFYGGSDNQLGDLLVVGVVAWAVLRPAAGGRAALGHHRARARRGRPVGHRRAVGGAVAVGGVRRALEGRRRGAGDVGHPHRPRARGAAGR